MFQGSVHPSSGLHTAIAATSGVMVTVVGAPAIAAVVPPSVLPGSKRSPGVPTASGFSVAWAVLSSSGIVQVHVAVPPGSVASITILSATIFSPSVVAAAVHPGSSVIPSSVETSVR